MSESTHKPLEGRLAVITGGGRGIGAACAQFLAEAGASVVVAARSTDQIEAVADDLRGAGHRAWGIPCDVADPESVDELARRSAEHGTVDILVANAGIASSSPVVRQELDEWNRIFAVNVTGVFLCTRAFLPGMLAAGWGRVVNVASVAGKMGGPYIAAYSASKHAVIGFTRSLALEVATQGVTVNAVCPGYVDTDMTVQSVDTIVGKTGKDEEAARGVLEQMSPQRRIFRSEEVAHQVLQLCHPLAEGVNGQSVIIDGGAFQA
ncbi:MAG: SDR family NAD(P)-dependent oxidoreductase [Acidobacteriota bacterium]